MKFAEQLKTIRKQRKLTQSQVGDALGISNQAVSQWERGETTPEYQHVIGLAEYLGVTIDALSWAPGSVEADPLDRAVARLRQQPKAMQDEAAELIEVLLRRAASSEVVVDRSRRQPESAPSEDTQGSYRKPLTVAVRQALKELREHPDRPLEQLESLRPPARLKSVSHREQKKT